MLVNFLLTGLFLSVSAIPTHLPGHVHDHDHVIPPHHVAPVTHARLVSETIEPKNESPALETAPVAEALVSSSESENDGFETAVNADSSVVSESVSSDAAVIPANQLPGASTEVTEARNDQLPAPALQETTVHHQEPAQQQIVHSEQMPQLLEPQQQLIHEQSILLKDSILPLVSNFPCEGHSRGYFADEMSDCKIFVQCNPNMDPHGLPFMERFLFQCPIETRWDQRLLTCVRMEDALPCPSSRLYWADTEMRFAAYADWPMQKIVPIPDGAMSIKGAPIVQQTQVLEHAPVVQKISQFIEPAPIKSAQVIEQVPQQQVIVESLPKLSQVVEQKIFNNFPTKSAPIVQSQFVEQAPLVQKLVESFPTKSAPIVQSQVVEQAPMVQKLVESFPTKSAPLVQKLVESFPTKTASFPTKTIIKSNNFGTKTIIKNNNFGTKTVQKVISSAPLLSGVKTVQKTTSFPTKTVVQKSVGSFPTKSAPLIAPAVKGMRKTIVSSSLPQPAMITRTIHHASPAHTMTRTFFRSPIQHFRSIPGAFVTRIA